MINLIDKINDDLNEKILFLKDKDYKNQSFKAFKVRHPWIAKSFDSEINNFYDNKLNKAARNIKLPRNIKQEIYLYKWIEENGFELLVDNYSKLQDSLYKVKSKFYARINYYDILIKENKIDAKLIFSDFLLSWESLIVKRTTEYRLKKIEDIRRKYMVGMFNRLEIMNKLGKFLKTTFNFLGRFWEIQPGELEKIDYKTLQKFAYYLHKDPTLNKIAELLGRFSGVSNLIEERVYEKIEYVDKWKPVGSWPEEIVGAIESKDLEHAFPQEFGYFGTKELQVLFFKRFADSRLLTFDFISDDLVPTPELVREIVQLPVPEKEGPFLLCIDTSSSMEGISEQIAKALSLAIVKIAVKEKRDCYLIIFSDGYKVLDLSKLQESASKLMEFLSMSFRHSTNIEPALKHSFEIMDIKKYFNADLLVISDMMIPTISNSIQQKISFLRKRRNRFHAITIGSSLNNVLNGIFNNNWLYDPSNPFTAEEIISSLESEYIKGYNEFNIKNLLFN